MTTPLQAVVQTATPKVQNGLWYSLRSAAMWVAAVVIAAVIGELITSLGACNAQHVLFFRCGIDWNQVAYAGELAILINVMRFVQGYLAKPPPQGG